MVGRWRWGCSSPERGSGMKVIDDGGEEEKEDATQEEKRI